MSKVVWKPGTFIYPIPAVMVTCGTMEKSNIITVAWTGILNTNPAMCYISVRPERYSHDIIKEKGEFAINLTTKQLVYATDWCGVKSGRNVDKFKGLNVQRDSNDIPYLTEHVSAIISARVVKQEDLGTHTLFIAEVTDAVSLTGAEPMTYAYYQAEVKPKKQTNSAKKIIGWRCVICQYVYEGETLPDDYTCPLCGHPKEDFEPIYES